MKARAQQPPDAELQDYFSGRAGVLLACLFDSRARGDAEGASDYDFGILLKAGADPDRRYELPHELGELLGTEAVDVILLRKAAWSTNGSWLRVWSSRPI